MENPCKIIFFGDSILRDCVSKFNEDFQKKFTKINANIINECIGGETSKDGLKRTDEILKQNPNVVIMGFGMNDKERKINPDKFKENILKIINEISEKNVRILIANLHPLQKNDQLTLQFNKKIEEATKEKRIRLIDIASYWKEAFRNPSHGLRDGCHLNSAGIKIYCRAFLETVPRRNTIVLWAYNGNPCNCNYCCPYCTYSYSLQKGDHFFGTVEQWQKAFKNSFGNEQITFYFGHGEPMIGKNFFEIVDMIGNEQNWKMRIISNLSGNLEKLVKNRIAKEHRLYVNGSFHPTMISIDDFLKKLLFLRKHGIETPVVYTLWPPFFERFEKDFEIFNKHNFLVHVRRFAGYYKGKLYPNAYTEEEKQFLAKYADDATIKYMLHNEPTTGKLSYTGMTLIFADEVGNIGYCDDARISMNHHFGNILKGNINLFKRPEIFKSKNVSDGTVDGVTNIIPDYYELENNHILSFAKQGGVYHTNKGVYYKNMTTDFNDSKTRAKYNFMPRNIKDFYYIIKNSSNKAQRIKHIIDYRLPVIKHHTKTKLKKYPMFYKLISKIYYKII